MKYYYYKIQRYDSKKKRWVNCRSSHITTLELNVGHVYAGSNLGVIKPISLNMVCEDDRVICMADKKGILNEVDL